jgi:hypothetical protein
MEGEADTAVSIRLATNHTGVLWKKVVKSSPYESPSSHPLARYINECIIHRAQLLSWQGGLKWRLVSR